jgi:15-cis-phytoene synthase
MPTPPSDVAYLTALVRADDRPRYYATLFAPAGARADLFAVYGFAAEIARVPDQVTEPGLGEIRLEWWRAGLKAAVDERGRGESPAIRAAAQIIARHSLPIGAFLGLADARSAELYSDPPPTMSDLMELLGKTDSVLFELSARVLGVSDADVIEAARHAGIAYGLATRLASLAHDRSRGRTFFTHDLLAMEELDASAVFAPEPSQALRNVAAAFVQLARHHLRAARDQASKLPRAARPAFLPLAIVDPLLNRVEELGAKLFSERVELSDFSVLRRMAWGRVRGLR